MTQKVAVVTGSNAGLGFSIVKSLCKKFQGVVYLTSLEVKLGKSAVSKLNKLGLHPEYHQLNVTDSESITSLRDTILEKYGGIDILINNAAARSSVMTNNSHDEDKLVINVNYKGMLLLQEIIFPIVRENGRILNISSSAGHLSNIKNKYWVKRLSQEDLKVEDINEFVEWFMESSKNGSVNKHDFSDNGSFPAYKVSKVAISALTKIQQRELEPKNISVNSMHPGIMKTDMTYGIGFLTPEQAAMTPVHIVLNASPSVKGEYIWYDGRIIDWYDTTLDVAYYSDILTKDFIFFSIYATAKQYLICSYS